ncbi:hypothetical protein P9990_27100 (plasmid) [Prescottella equi]|uniref:hypothetical protein n=1 Tax=Rhodococcus hoagii TaxID=43767 RepID=UPI00257569BC|nr:hypothetical protein [Prescottella equi]WJJ14650.1 hypothetical protein P9990_27100 [Prescottella equi]
MNHADIPRHPERDLAPAEVEIQLAGIRTALQMGGTELIPEAEEAARAVLAGEMTADEAIARADAALAAREAAENDDSAQ